MSARLGLLLLLAVGGAGCAGSTAAHERTEGAAEPAPPPPPDRAGPREGGAEAFVAEYIRLQDEFDPALANLYADDAVIRESRKKPDGQVVEGRLEGAEIKRVFPQAMKLAEQRHDRSEYSNVEYRDTAEGVEVTLERRSLLKCYTDDEHSMTLRTDGEGGLRIVEEHVHTQTLSSCPDRPLGPVFDRIVEAVQPKLPLKVDAETRLDALKAEGDTLRYEFTLINIGPGQMDPVRFSHEVRKATLPGACLSPAQREVLDNGGRLLFAYHTNDGRAFAETAIVETDCP